MDCKVCELRQRQFYCQDCLRIHLREFRNGMQVVAADRAQQLDKATRLLAAIEKPRIARADVAALELSVETLTTETTRVKADNARKRERISSLRAGIASRRTALSAARALQDPATVAAQKNAFIALQDSVTQLSSTILKTRVVLIQELVEVFGIVEIGGRPAFGRLPGARGEWSICGLILPVPGDMRRHPGENISAALVYTLQFIRLITFYLGVKLPFQVSWTGGTAGVGKPWMAAGRGGESGGWAKWFNKHPLYMSSSSTSPSTSSSSTVATSGPQTTTTAKYQESFTTALTMLLYNVSYLAHTQGLEIGLSQAGEVLRNLWAICCSPDLGRRSHQTVSTSYPTLSAPTSAAFPLDFDQLLQVTTATPTAVIRKRRGKHSRRSTTADEEDGEWDFVENDGGIG